MALPNTHFGVTAIDEIISKASRLFFAGIGGISMNSLAHISLDMGLEVIGYDRTKSDITEKLEKMGATVYYEGDASHVEGCDALIYTVAMPEDTPEYVRADELGIPRISRADYLGYIMTKYTFRPGFSGTHGKSTTTAMTAHILTELGENPTLSGGAPLKNGSVDIIGGKKWFVFEACEYMDSFLDFNPTVSVVLNIEMDHVDYFKSIEQMRGSYTKFMQIAQKNAGFAVYNYDDENCRVAAGETDGKTVSFSRGCRDAKYHSRGEITDKGFPQFDIYEGDRFLTHVKLAIPGAHNITDALAAFTVCAEYGLEPRKIAEAIGTFEGIGRRMEKLKTLDTGAVLYSDYAHHPTEIAAALKGARAICEGKLIVVFQSHTYSRTAGLFDGFVSSLSENGADRVIMCKIYPARETNIYGVSSAKLAEKITENGTPCECAEDFADAAKRAVSGSAKGDMIVVMGAGDVIKTAEILCE